MLVEGKSSQEVKEYNCITDSLGIGRKSYSTKEEFMIETSSSTVCKTPMNARNRKNNHSKLGLY